VVDTNAPKEHAACMLKVYVRRVRYGQKKKGRIRNVVIQT
jgi:hypothetical protein